MKQWGTITETDPWNTTHYGNKYISGKYYPIRMNSAYAGIISPYKYSADIVNVSIHSINEQMITPGASIFDLSTNKYVGNKVYIIFIVLGL